MINRQETIDLAVAHGYRLQTGHADEVMELVLIREWLRRKYKVHIENNQDERGAMNHKTSEYFTCSISRRIPNPRKKGQKYVQAQHYQTFSKYEDALQNGIIWGIEMAVGNGTLQKFIDSLA